MKNVVKSYCQCIPEILDQLTSSRSIFVLMGFLVVGSSLMHIDISTFITLQNIVTKLNI